MKKTILIICSNNLNKAPRFLMEVAALKDNYRLIAAGYNSASCSDYDYIDLDYKAEQPVKIDFHLKYPSPIRKIVSFLIRIFYFRMLYRIKMENKLRFNYQLSLLKEVKHDLIIVHHLRNLELAVALSKFHKTKIIFNAHEYYPLEFENDENWMKTTHLECMEICHKYLKEIHGCFCVGENIAKKYKDVFGLGSVIIPNTKPFYDLLPKNTGSAEKIKLIHHGAVIPSRKLELMIEVMNYLNDDYHLTLILIPAGHADYYKKIKEMALANPRVSLAEPVNVDEIPEKLNAFDIGIFLLPHTNFNYANALPNKFFEFVQARLMIAIGPSPEMESLVRKYDLGVVAGDFNPASLAEKIQALSRSDIMYHKQQVNKYAYELSDSVTKELMVKSAQNLI